MRYFKLMILTVVFACLCTSGCSMFSSGGEAKDIYEKVQKMYEKNEIKQKMVNKDLYISKKDNVFFNRAMFTFESGSAYKYQYYRLLAFKKQGREAEEQMKQEKENIKRDGEVYIKGNILIQVPKKDNPNLDQKLYDLFMSYVK